MFACCVKSPDPQSTEKVIEEARPPPAAPPAKPAPEAPKPEPKKEEPAPTPAPTPAAPAKAAAQFTVNVSKGGGSVGLDVVQAGDVLFVEGLKAEGAIIKYNGDADADKKVVAGDFICSVNKVDQAAAMLEQLQKESNLEIVIKKSREMTVSVPKDGKLGLDLNFADSKTYIIVRAITDGCVQKYNEQQSQEKKLTTPFRILQVDGTSGSAKDLCAKLQASSGTVQLTVSLPVE